MYVESARHCLWLDHHPDGGLRGVLGYVQSVQFAGLGRSFGLGPAGNRASCFCKKLKKISPFKLGYYHANM